MDSRYEDTAYGATPLIKSRLSITDSAFSYIESSMNRVIPFNTSRVLVTEGDVLTGVHCIGET